MKANEKEKIYIIEDDVAFAALLTAFLEKKGFEVSHFSTVSNALRKLENDLPNLVICDYQLPDSTGMDFLRAKKARGISVPVIMFTSYGEVNLAVESMKAGAADYLIKPAPPEELLKVVHAVLHQDTEKAKAAVKPKSTGIIGESKPARELESHIRLVAGTPYSVLIIGESGTGKENAAQKIHEYSARKDSPFLPIDCGAIPRDLATAEFFGYMKGAFTGAVESKAGIFEQAGGGTIFLDEIGNLAYENQVKLLRVLQEKSVRRLGSSDEIPVDFRLIAATNEDLRKKIDAGEFREDLYHRLNEFTITIPSLRDRKEDVLDFASYFLKEEAGGLNKHVEGFSEEAMQLILNYSWPGNLREMRNAIKRSVLLTRSLYIPEDVLPLEIRLQNDGIVPELADKSLRGLKAEKALLEYSKIREALQASKYNRSVAAEKLGISRKTLYNKLKRYNLL